MMKKTALTLCSLVFICALSGFSPAEKSVLKPTALKAAKVVFGSISGPTMISAAGGPYTYTATGLTYNSSDPYVLWICGDPVKNEQIFAEVNPDGSCTLDIYGSSFTTRGSMTLTIQDSNGNTVASYPIYVTN
ncbi:hypothetical protein [Pedobacter nutrimenti]|nr:hypothetical protein [Pedobacter nutrimenti]